MRDALNILVLHNLGDPAHWRTSMVDKELCLPLCAPCHNYVVQDFAYPVRSELDDIAFDAVILTQSFLSKRRDPRQFEHARRTFAVVCSRAECRIALPQDEYDCSTILDEWMTDWGVDVVYPVCSSHWDVLFPEYRKKGTLRQGYTGYISEALIERGASCAPIKDRAVDVSYRASRHLTGVFGRFGKAKNEYGERFLRAASGTELSIDVSTRPADVITGARWYEFVSSTRAMLGVNSGSSVLDPMGHVARRVRRFLRRHPDATFEEVEDACFPGEDGRYELTGIAPRHLEAACLRTVQVLTPGEYGDFLRPWEHYLPLDLEMTEVADVVQLLRDHEHLQHLADRARETVLSFPELRYGHHVQELLDTIASRSRLSVADRAKSVPVIRSYQGALEESRDSFWARRRLLSGTRKLLADAGLRKLKYLLRDAYDRYAAGRS